MSNGATNSAALIAGGRGNPRSSGYELARITQEELGGYEVTENPLDRSQTTDAEPPCDKCGRVVLAGGCPYGDAACPQFPEDAKRAQWPDNQPSNSQTTAREMAAATAFMEAMGNRPLSDFAKGGGCGFLLRCMRAALRAADSIQEMDRELDEHLGESA